MCRWSVRLPHVLSSFWTEEEMQKEACIVASDDEKKNILVPAAVTFSLNFFETYLIPGIHYIIASKMGYIMDLLFPL